MCVHVDAIICIIISIKASKNSIISGNWDFNWWPLFSGRVYKNWCLDALEGSFALNLTMLAAATYCVKISAGNQLAVGYTSTFIALKTFVGIVLYQIFQQCRHTKLWKKMAILNFELWAISIALAANTLYLQSIFTRNIRLLC